MIRRVQDEINKNPAARDKFMEMSHRNKVDAEAEQPKKKRAKKSKSPTKVLHNGKEQSKYERHTRLMAALGAAPKPSPHVLMPPPTNYVTNVSAMGAQMSGTKPGLSPPRGVMSGRGHPAPGRALLGGRGFPGRGLPLTREHPPFRHNLSTPHMP